MAKTKREYIIATFIISCAATVLSIVSVATEDWVTANLDPNLDELKDASVTYGLFAGKLVQNSLAGKKESIVKITCIFGKNICGYSVATSSDDREKEIDNILKEKSCNNEKKLKNIKIKKYRETFIEELENNNIYDIELLNNTNVNDKMRYIKLKRSIFDKNFAIFEGNQTNQNNTTTSTTCDPNFLNAGLWLSTIIFLSFSIFFGALTATLSVVNTTGNPVNPYLNIWGLYVWNILSAILLIFTMCLWGAQFGAILLQNVGISFTLDGTYKSKNVTLDFSYWMMLGPIFLHSINVGLFYLRQYLIDKEPTITEDKLDVNDRDGMIFVY